MRYAIVSDLHANLRAWDAVLADLCELGADSVVCLGDVVGYGPKPSEVLQAIQSVTENCVMGNHDAAAAGIMDYSVFNDQARGAIEWTRSVLDSGDQEVLGSFPLAIEAGEILFVHAEANHPARFGYVTDSRIARENFSASQHFVTFLGHTHFPKVFEQNGKGKVRELPDEDLVLEADKRYLVNVGSVGEPRDPRDLRARYVIYDDKTRMVTFRRVEFDIVAYRNDLESTTLAIRPFFLRVYEEAWEGPGRWSTSEDNLAEMTVANDSQSLLDLGQVARVTHLRESTATPKRSRSRRFPAVFLALAAVLTLALLGFWLTRDENPRLEAGRTRVPYKPTPPARLAPSPPPESEAGTTESTAPPVVNAPDDHTSIAQVPPAPHPALPEPLPVAPASTEITRTSPLADAWWRMEEQDTGTSLVDETGRIRLSAIQNGPIIQPLAPDPLPANQAKNLSARQLGVWQEHQVQNHFALTANHSFTFEAWVYLGNLQTPVFLFGTRTDREDGRGWHLDLRPRAPGQTGESISFFYDSGLQQRQALASDVKLTDFQAHHVAVVWDHDDSFEQGLMMTYLDGVLVSSNTLPHSWISGRQIHPFRLGARLNPDRLGLDELRFTRRALSPHQFLLQAPVTGPTLIRADGRKTDSWSDPANWEGDQIPRGQDNAVIGPGLKVQIHHQKPTPFTGSLVLREGASLHLWSPESETVVSEDQDGIILERDSVLVLRSPQMTILGRLELRGEAHLFGGISKHGHHRTRRLTCGLSGTGTLHLHGVEGNLFAFEFPATFTGGIITQSSKNQSFQVDGGADRCFGHGPVEIRNDASLRIREGLTDTIADHATLILSGSKGTAESKFILESDETVGRFIIDGQDQGEGIFGRHSHPQLIKGRGRLTVKAPLN